MENGSRVAGAAVIAYCVLFAAGCVRAPHIITPEPHSVSSGSLTALLAGHPLAATQNISALPLGHTDAFSYHLVQVRDREQPHVHATHDLVVTLLRGKGQMYVRGIPTEMRAGDVAVVTHGTPHYFVNTGCIPTAAFVTFAPPYDGTDQVPITPGH
jgi:mannose-6-phosphate isomerase-like protein (cupin superfamily)